MFLRRTSFHSDVNRPKAVDAIYSRLRNVLTDLDLQDSWREYRKPSGEYFEPFNHMFVNKSLFEGRRVSLGIYEDILNAGGRMTIEFFSYDEEFSKKMEKKIRSIAVFKDMDGIATYDGDENYLSFFFVKSTFLKQLETIVKGVLSEYLALFGMEEES